MLILFLSQGKMETEMQRKLDISCFATLPIQFEFK